MANISTKSPADQAKTKAQLLTELNELRQRVAQCEAADPLNSAEERYRSVIAAMAEGVVMQQRSGEIVACNPAAEQILGLTREQLMGRASIDSRWRAIHADGTPFPGQNHPAMVALQTGQPQRHVIMGVHKPDGRLTWILINAEPMFQPGASQPYAVVTTFTDVTAQRQTEELLRESEARLRTVVENSRDGINLLDLRTGKYVFMSPSQVAMTGFTVEEMNNFPVEEAYARVHPDDLAISIEQQQQVATGQISPSRVEYRWKVKSGEYRWFSDSRGMVRDSQGNPIALVGISRDITERKQVEAQLHIALEKYRVLFETFPLGISITDEKGNLMEVNRESERLLGLLRQDHLQRTFDGPEWDLVRSDGTLMPPAEFASVRALKEKRLVENVEMGIVKEAGKITWLNVSAAPIPLEGYGVAIAYGDITERKRTETALRESEARFKTVFQASPLGISISRLKDNQLLEVNEAWLTMSGFNREEVIGRTSVELMQWVKSDDRERLLRQLGQQGVVTWFEAPIRHKSGRVMELLMSAEITELAGEPCLLALSQDITTHKQVERIEAAQLAVSQILVESPQPAAALRPILESIATRLEWDLAKLWWPDSSGSRLVWQEGWRVSAQPEVVEFDRLSRDYTFEPGEGLAGAVWQTGRAIWDQELRLAKLSAEVRALGFHSATGIPIIRDGVTVGVMTFFSRSGRPLEERLLATLTDLGRQIGQFLARKEIEENLRRYEQMVSTSPDWLSLVDRNYVYRIVNQTYLTLHHKNYDQIVGHSVAEFFGDAAFATVMKPRLDQGLAGEVVQYQVWVDFPVIGQRFMDVTHAPYREKDGSIAGVLISGRDMTEAKLLEERLSQTQKMEMVGQLAAGMAHHYNSMLTGIIGFTSLSLHTLPPSDPVARNLERVLNTAERMAVLVRQLLAFAQKQLLLLKTIPLNDLVLQLQGRLKQMVPAPIEFIFELAPLVGEVRVDPRQFEYLLQALVSNAVDAMPDGGRLTLTTTNVSLGPVEAGSYDLPPGDYFLLTVKDTGLGLSDEVKAHLFEPFFTTKDVGQGMGLGVPMSLGIARQHGGHLLAEGEPGQGTTFMLYLPCLAPPQPPPTQAASAQTILLIEAEPMVREFVAEILSDEGYTVLKAANAEVALQRMADQPEVSLHLLLTPAHSNSPALIEQLKIHSPSLKVIFLIDEVADLSFELKGTRADFLLKPFAPSSLMQKIQAVLEAPLE